MICSNCGKEIAAGSKFCTYCGMPVRNSQDGNPADKGPHPYETEFRPADGAERPSSPPPPPPRFVDLTEEPPAPPKKKKGTRKRWVVLILMLAVVAAAAVVGYQFYTSPSAEFTRAVEGGDLSGAYAIYEREMAGEGLSEEMVQMLVNAATQAQEEYMAGTISYEEVSDRLSTLANFPESAVQDAVNAAQTAISNKRQIDTLLQTAAENVAAGNYEEAIQNYQAALDLDASSEAAKQGLEEATSAYEQSVIDDAYAATEIGEWDSALEIIDTYQNTYGQNEAMAEAYADIEKKRPVTLKNLTMVSSEDLEVIEEVVKDRWDNIYDGAVSFDASNDAYGYYSLGKKYTKFSGVVFVSPEATNEKNMSVTIYKDEEIVYHLDSITEDTPPASFEVDVTDASTLRIVTANEGSYSRGHLLFGNTAFEKAEA